MTYQVSTLQSLLQLSVALNLGFLGYLSLSADKLKREESLVNDLVILSESVRSEVGSNDEKLAESKRISTGILELKQKYTRSVVHLESSTHGWPRYCVLGAAVLSFLGLVYTSVRDVELDLATSVFALILYVPFFCVIASNHVTTYRISRQIKKERDMWDQELLKLKLSVAERS